MRIGLLTTLNTNLGDDFIREGLMHIVSQIAPGVSCEFVPINKHQPQTAYPFWHPIRLFYEERFHPRLRMKPLRRKVEHWLAAFGLSRFDDCDLVLQCGTPIIWDGCRQSEWADLIWRDVLLRLSLKGKPVLNLGGGSCYPWERQPKTLVGHPDEEFIRTMLKAARVTIVRDTLAQTLLGTLGYSAPHLCCPAMLAGQAFTKPCKPTRKVLVNYMPGGGHYDFEQGIDPQAWETTMRRLLSELCRQGWQPILLAHNEREFKIAKETWPELPSVLPAGPREYFETARDASFGIFNRLHASVAVAGLGIPSIAVGNDSRNLMVAALGEPVFYVKEATFDLMLSTVNTLLATREAESTRLLELREKTLSQYKERLRPYFEG